MFTVVAKGATAFWWRLLTKGLCEGAVAVATTVNVEWQKLPAMQPWSQTGEKF